MINPEIIIERSNDPRLKVLPTVIPTAIDIGWTAGIIDGEGSVSIYPTKHAGERNGYRIVVRVSNTDRRMVEKLSMLWGGSIHITRQNSSLGYRPINVWTVGSKTALFMLKAVVPALVTKRDQARIAIELQERVIHKMGYEYLVSDKKRRGMFDGSVITPSEMEVRKKLYQAVKEMNTRRIHRNGVKPDLICPGIL